MLGTCTLRLTNTTLCYCYDDEGYQCDKCGNLNSCDHRYCAYCGRKVKEIITTEHQADFIRRYELSKAKITVIPWEQVKEPEKIGEQCK